MMNSQNGVAKRKSDNIGDDYVMAETVHFTEPPWDKTRLRREPSIMRTQSAQTGHEELQTEKRKVVVQLFALAMTHHVKDLDLRGTEMEVQLTIYKPLHDCESLWLSSCEVLSNSSTLRCLSATGMKLALTQMCKNSDSSWVENLIIPKSGYELVRQIEHPVKSRGVSSFRTICEQGKQGCSEIDCVNLEILETIDHPWQQHSSSQPDSNMKKRDPLLHTI